MRSAFPPLAVLLLAPGIPAADTVDYLRDVKPLLASRCASCHGALRQKAELRLDTAALLGKGGRSGPAIVPGKAATSLLVARITRRDGRRMPPEEEGEPLTDQQVSLLRTWIDQGARAPDEATPPDPRLHWAFRSPVRAPLPAVADPAWKQNPIDAFVAAEQQRRKLPHAAPADRASLLRRVHIDLTGLPPTRADLHAFLADNSPDAYEKVVDRLLASPQYGERWARHWMDVWRYSDWYGRRAVPDVWNSAPQVFRWRDWIVDSLNAGKGYDRMVQEMLAADEIAPGDDRAAVATGFLVRNWYALNPNQWMRDNVEHTAKAFLGLTLNCAHCHDHKYDPISQEEYFRLRAFFEPLGLRQDRWPGEAAPGPFQRYEYSVLRKVVTTGTVTVYDEKPDAPTRMYIGGDERNLAAGKGPVKPGAPAALGGDRLKIAPVDLPPTVSYPGLKPFIQQEETARREQAVAAARARGDQARALLADFRRRIDAVAARGALPPRGRLQAEATVALMEAAIRLADAALATAEAELASVRARIAADKAWGGATSLKGLLLNASRGDAVKKAELLRLAAKAERQAALAAAEEKFLTAKPEQQNAARKAVEAARQAPASESDQTPLSPLYPDQSTGRRKALALWITSRDNPLTARVAVNHIWMRHFGAPLVETVFDLGRNGKKPTHPELLDWLAVEFMDSGWDMKKLHRLIVTSQAYRQGVRGQGSEVSADPESRYLWRFPRRRVEAEVVRDAVLFSAGELDLARGGYPIDNAQEATSHRRSLYFTTYPEDGGHLRFMTSFDPPDPCDGYRRSASVMPQQALVLTNSRLVVDQSRLLARKLWADVSRTAKAEEAFIIAAFEQVLTRRPDEREQALCLEFLQKQTALFRTTPVAAVSATEGVAPSADPALRARESLVRTLFNHDDFVTIR